MRKLLSLLAALVLCTIFAYAQLRTISGTVTDDNGSPLPFATIKIKGARTGVSADAEGKFTIKVKAGDVLVVSAQGSTERDIPVTNQDVYTISLQKSNNTTMQEVVVTSAFGIKKSARVTPFSSQVISSEALNMTRQTNVNNALAGKVAGVQTRSQSSAKLDQEAFLRIRGGLGLGDKPPVYVVDGTIVGSFDVNPDDIEDVTVLKGANATALYGSQATGGVIVINTRKRVALGGIGVEVNSGVTFDKVYILPEYQNRYGGGSVPDLIQFNWQAGMPNEWKALDGKFYHDYTDDASWGPRMAGQEYIPWYAWYPDTKYSYKTAKLVPQPDNARDFWQNGLTTNNNVSFGKNGQGYNFRASYTNQFIKGIIPYSSSTRNTIFFTASVDLSSHFTISTNVNFTANTIKGSFVDGYANQSSGSFNQWFHRDLDMGIIKELRDARSPFGTLATWNLRFNPDGYSPASPANFYKANYWYNYYAYYANINNKSDRNRFWGDASLTYKLNSNFKVRGTVRKNQRNTHYENITRSILEESALQTGVLAAYATGETNLLRYDYELVGSFNKQFGDFTVSANAGGNIFTYEYNDFQASTSQGLNVPDLYAITNSKATAGLTNNRQKQQVNSVFGQGDVEFKKLASATFAVRKDWGSTLSPSKPGLLYPSAGASLVFSELLSEAPSWFSFGKVFGSWGKKPESLPIYATNFAYTVNQNTWNGNFLMTTPDLFPDPNIQGSLITTIEGGIDLRFLKNRLGVNLVYYNEVADKIPVRIGITGASGFTQTDVNAAKVTRTGVEAIVNGRPIVNKNFSWDASATFGYLINNPVKQLYGTQTQIPIPGQPDGDVNFNSAGAFGTRFARAFQVLGEDWGQLIGGGIKRNNEGKAVLDPTSGLYINDVNKKWGSIVPKVSGGFVNSFNYKEFNFSFSLDYQVGGKFFSLSEQWGTYSGIFKWTAAINDKGKNVRDDVADGGGVHVVGVSSVDLKTPVDMYIDAQTYFHGFYNQQVAEPFVHDLTFVKLREVSIGYRIPINKIGNMKKYFQGAQFSVISRNPWLIYSDSKNFDPSEIVSNFGEDGQFPGTRSLGVNLKLIF